MGEFRTERHGRSQRPAESDDAPHHGGIATMRGPGAVPPGSGSEGTVRRHGPGLASWYEEATCGRTTGGPASWRRSPNRTLRPMRASWPGGCAGSRALIRGDRDLGLKAVAGTRHHRWKHREGHQLHAGPRRVSSPSGNLRVRPVDALPTRETIINLLHRGPGCGRLRMAGPGNRLGDQAEILSTVSGPRAWIVPARPRGPQRVKFGNQSPL